MIGNNIIAFVLFLIFAGCRQAPVKPKPRAYPRIEFPQRDYKEYSVSGCPFTFQYPAYAEIQDKEKNCWFDVYMPDFEARLHCSYLPVKNRAEYDELIKDVFVIAAKINERANYMEESRIRNPQGIECLSFQWTGPAASPVHFFLADTTQHFFKAALYFDSKVQPDSLAPITAFIQKDIDQMISSFAWKE